MESKTENEKKLRYKTNSNGKKYNWIKAKKDRNFYRPEFNFKTKFRNEIKLESN